MSDGAATSSAFRQGTVFQAVLLGSFAMLAAAFLAAGDRLTEDAIAQRMAEDLQASLVQVVPADTHDNDMLADPLTMKDTGGRPVTVFRGTFGGAVQAVAFRTGGFGYAGAIELIMGVDRHGRLLGVRVLSHAETPGLGDKIEVAKDDWILGFTGLSIGDPPVDKWKVKKDGGRFDQFSGATVTPRAVVDAVREGLEFFAANKAEMLEPPAPKQADEGDR